MLLYTFYYHFPVHVKFILKRYRITAPRLLFFVVDACNIPLTKINVLILGEYLNQRE